MSIFLRLCGKQIINFFSLFLISIIANSQAPLQPANIMPPNGTTNYSNNTVTVTVTDPNGDLMTVKLYGRKKTCTSTAPNFSIIGLPDTQFYTEEVQGTNSAGGGHNGIFKAQTQWIADHRLDSNIAFVVQLGDCVQNGDNPPGTDKEIEWKRADTAMKNIENPNVPTADGIPYGICVGNHDESPIGSITGTTQYYNQYFGNARFTGRGYYGGRYGTTNNNDHYELFTSGGIDFIHISIEYFPDGTSAKLQTILDWADALLKAYPARKGIISTHNMLGTGNPAAFQGPGQKIYDDLKDNANLFLMLAGHVAGEGRRSDTYNGNTIYSLMSDYQNGFTNGGNGFLRIMQFRPAENLMTVKTYSPYATLFRAGTSSDFTIPVNFSCPFTLIGTNTAVVSGSSTTFTWPGLQLSTDYEWYVTIDDGNGNVTTSTISGFTTWNGTPPPAGTGSLRFTDTTYVDLGNSAELHLTNFTLEAWVKIEGYGSTAQTGGGGLVKVVPIISKGRAEGETPAVDANYFLGYESGTNKLTADFEDNFNSGNHPVTSVAKIPMNTWTHVGASFDVTSKTWRLFIGATTEITVLGATYTPQSLSQVKACIGATLNSTGVPLGSFNGRIDEVRIWNKALTTLDPGELTSGTGLVGRWSFGDGTGTTITNSVSGGANGTIVNNYEWVTGFNEVDPTTNASIDFNGVHDYVSFGAAPSLNTTAPSSTGFTLEGWVKVEGAGITTTTGGGGLTAAIPIISKGAAQSDAPANINMNYFLGINSSNVLVADFEEATGSNTGLNHPVTGTTAIPNNIWTHVAVTYNISDGAWNFYVNGNTAGTGNAGAGKVPENNSIQHASIGTTLTSLGLPAGFFNGKIDEVRIWNRALTQVEIQANLNNQITTGSGLIGRWGLNQNGDSIAVASVGVNGIIRSVNPYIDPTIGAAAWVSSGFIPTVVATTNTTTTINPNSIAYGTSSIIFTATVTPNPGGGTVQFYLDGSAIGAPVPVAAGTGIATLSTYSPALLNAGSHTVRGDFSGSGGFGSNTGTNASFTVTPAVLTYVAMGASRVYGAANPVLTGSVTGFQNGETVASATTGTLSFATTATVTDNVGNYPSTGSGLTANNGNYIFVQAAGNSGALIITAAFLTNTANAATRIYGDADPAFTGTVTGFVNGETQATATTGTLTFTTTATITSNVGTWPINGSGLTTNNSNYEFVQAAANATKLTITKRSLDFSGARVFINGNSTFTAAQLTPGNIVNGDVLSISGSATVSSPAVGTYTSFVTNGLSTLNTNYQTTGGSVNVSIITVPVTNHKSLRFTDTTYIDLGNAASLHLTNFTVEAWVKIEGYGSTTKSGSAGGQDGIVPIITKGRSDPGAGITKDVNYFLGYRLSDKKLVADFEDNNGSLNHSVTSAAILPMNTWVHVGASFDKNSNTWRLFIDNTIEQFILPGALLIPQSLSDVPACIGSSLNTGGTAKPGSFNGRIDEVRIWNTALTALDQGELTTTPANLVGRWSLDEGTGTVVANAVTSGPSGSIINTSEWVSGFNVADSTTDASIRFNGVHDYVTFGTALSLGAATYTLEGWINIAGAGSLLPTTGGGGLTNVYPIITKGRNESDGSNLDMNYFLGLSDTYKLVTDFEEGATGATAGLNHPLTGTTTLPLNQWQHIAVTYDGNNLRLYLNGNLEATSALIAKPPQSASIQHASIGSALNSLGVAQGFFNGKIDEVKIWNRALSATELQPTTSACSPTSTMNLLGYWNFNENGNITANNSVTGGVNGSLVSNNISINPTNGGPSWACNGFTGNYYRSKNATGTWSVASDWETLNGTTWTVATKPPGYTDNVIISSGTILKVTTGPVSCNNLTVNSGGILYKNTGGTNSYINVYGHIVCNGTIGRGATFDAISFNIEGDTCSITGTGTFDCSRIRKTCTGHATTNLTFYRDVNLRFPGTAMFNEASSTFFNVKIAPGVTVNCLGDVNTANSAGSFAIHGANGTDAGYPAGSLIVDGTLNLSGTGSGISTLYLNNTMTFASTNTLWPVSVTIDSTGTINAGQIVCSASGPSGHSFTIKSGGKLNITGQPTFYVAPSLTNNSYTLESGSIIEYSKAGNQTVYTFGSVNYSNLFASGSGTKMILAALGVTDTVKAYGNAILASGGNLTLLSSATKTARVAYMPATANITGKVTVERYIGTGTFHPKTWQLLATPVSGTQTINEAWQDTATTSNQNRYTGFGTQITSDLSPLPLYFDVLSQGPSVKVYNSFTEGYDGIASTTIPVYNKKGYFVFVRGDRTVTTVNGLAKPTVLRTKGPLFTPSNPPPVDTVLADKFESMGNPYASALDIRNIVTTGGVDEFFYVWDPKLAIGSAYGLGAFQTFSKNGSDYIVTPGTGSYGSMDTINNFIQSGQAFFRHATGADGKVIFDENNKASGSVLVSTPALIPQPQLRSNLYGVNTNGSTFITDGVLNNFGDAYSNDVDGLDAMKTINTGENLSITVGGKLLAIERSKPVTEKDTIFLNLAGMKVQQYRFEFIPQNFNAGLIAFLEDSYLNIRTPIDLINTRYIDFNIENTAASYVPGRFRIVFNISGALPVTFTSIKAYRQNRNINIEWNVENEMNIKNYTVEKSNDGVHFKPLITVAATRSAADYQAMDDHPETGYNYYRIRSNDNNGKANYSKIVKVWMGNLQHEFTVYPNPATDGIINLQFVNQPAGKYGIRLLNKLGQVMLSKQIVHNEGSSNETLQLNHFISHGIYHLEITKPDTKKENIKVLYF